MIASAHHIEPQPFSFRSPTTAPLAYIETTVPIGMTLGEYRRALPRTISRWKRLKELAGATR